MVAVNVCQYLEARNGEPVGTVSREGDRTVIEGGGNQSTQRNVSRLGLDELPFADWLKRRGLTEQHFRQGQIHPQKTGNSSSQR